jgi:hypothetical protein
MNNPAEGDVSGQGNSFGMFPAPSLGGFQRLGVQTAAQVIEGFIDLLGAGGATRSADRVTDPSTGPEPGFAQLRVDVARALDLYGELVRRSFEGYADLLEQRQRANGARADAGDDGPLMLRVAADGAAAAGTVWIHNTTDGPACAELHLTDLTAHDGKVVPSSTGCFEPAALTIAPGGSASARLEVVVAGFPSGIYHGHVVAGGLPEAALPVRLIIGAAPA